jgi:long-chain acyl-CoA synthetase
MITFDTELYLMFNYKSLTFPSFIEEITLKYANNNALGFIDDEPLTYAAMGKKITALKAYFEALGIKPGDKAVILSQNMPNWALVYFALQCMGVIAVPVLPDFNTHELQNVLLHSEASIIFVSGNLEYKFVDIKKEFVRLFIRLDDMTLIGSSNRTIAFDENAECVGSYSPDENALSVLLYTSGTTGDSKGVMLSQKNVIFNAIQGSHVEKINERDKFLSVLPLAHTYENTIGLILPLLNGASVTYLRKPPTASILLPALQLVKPEFMLTVPMIIEKVYRNKILPEIQSKFVLRQLYKYKLMRKLIHRLAGRKLSRTFGGRLKFFGIGGSKLDPQVEIFLRDARFPYAIGYGLTETSPLLAGSNPRQTKFQAIGPKVIECELKINNPDAETNEGEIWAKGPNIMLGYYKNDHKTREVITDDGWFKTGDLGVFDKQGWIIHRGRLKNMIVGANGENIYPEEIESLINNFNFVVESIVLEKKGKLVALVHFNREELEQRVRALTSQISHRMDEKIDEITHKVDEAIDELASELKQYINTRVNKFSQIQLLIVHPDPFQKTATQKIKRYLYC